MRVPNSLFPNSLVGQLHELLKRQGNLQTQAATGQRVNSGEEDPAAMGRIMRSETHIRSLQQYESNINQLNQHGRAVYAAVSGLQKISTRASEIATLADGTKSAEDLKSYATELTHLIKQGVDFANRKYQGEYLFGGTKSSQQPFNIQTGGNGQLTAVTYAGNDQARQVEIGSGVTLSSMVPGANASGTGAAGLIADSRTGADFFGHLISLRDHLLAGDTAAIAATDLPALGKDEDHLIAHIAESGATQARLETAAAAISAQISAGKSEISDLTSADLADTLVRLSQVQTAYTAALQSGAKIMQQSLMDYIR